MGNTTKINQEKAKTLDLCFNKREFGRNDS